MRVAIVWQIWLVHLLSEVSENVLVVVFEARIEFHSFIDQLIIQILEERSGKWDRENSMTAMFACLKINMQLGCQEPCMQNTS